MSQSNEINFSAKRPCSPGLVFKIVFIALCAYIFLDFLAIAIRYIRYPFAIDYGEGCGLLFLDQLKNRGTYFFDINDYPFSYAAYPPLFFFFSWAVQILGLPMLGAMRLVSVIGTFGAVSALYLLIEDRTRNRVFALGFSAAFLSFWFVKLWAPLARVDMVACFFSLTGLYAFQFFYGDKRRYFAFFFFALAFFVKQNTVMAPAAILLFSLIRKEQRPYFLSYLGVYLIPILAGFFLLNVYTGGEAFRHLILYTAQRKFDLVLFLVCLELWLMALIVLLPMAYPLRYLDETIKTDRLLYGIYLVLNLGSLASIGLTGANFNYFIEPTLSVLIFGAIIASEWIKKEKAGEHIPRATMVLILVSTQLAWSWGLTGYEQKSSRPWANFSREFGYKGSVFWSVASDDFHKNVKGELFSDDLAAIVTNHRPVFLGCSLPLAEDGLWEPRRLIDDCNKGRFSYGVVGSRAYAIKGLMACLENNYHLKDNWEDFSVYEVKR